MKNIALVLVVLAFGSASALADQAATPVQGGTANAPAVKSPAKSKKMKKHSKKKKKTENTKTST